MEEATEQAARIGALEADPNWDLDGWDAMRKLVILGRVAGWPLEQANIEVESLTPPSLANLPLEEFMDSISAKDESIGEWRETAREAGLVLRYLARVENGHGSVGLKAIPASNPMAAIKVIALHTRRYDQEPLYMPPPSLAELPMKAQLVSVGLLSLPELYIPPPGDQTPRRSLLAELAIKMQ